ncbi:hypothetical protein [Natronosalvus halobius]|uniref:hypothetical protein n=1 Tax=Natronosalvus halobius TaxID=2953746 RepID=UPI00209D0FFF|nr:hypothetical protein [Natronosalvus halobius]USZ71261.1 hypothetical protein NGM15_14430 [Natronosalvus halobius]
MAKYEPVIRRVFEKKAEEFGTEEEIPFRRSDIEDAMDELDISVGNVPDIPYAYRSRRPLPRDIAEYGYTAVIIDDTREGSDPTYMFTKQEQLIPVPDDDEIDATFTTSAGDLPGPVQEYIGKDEQGALTQVRYAGLLDDFTGLETYHLQSHLRMRVKGREAELDDLYVGVDEEDNHHALAVEAKGAGETLNRNQLIRNTRGIEHKSDYPNSVETLAVKLDDNGHFYLFEFEVYQEDGDDKVSTERVWKYEFDSK